MSQTAIKDSELSRSDFIMEKDIKDDYEPTTEGRNDEQTSLTKSN